MIENDTWYRCNICGREGRVGRCCSDEDRTPLNALAKAEQERIKGAKNTKILNNEDDMQNQHWCMCEKLKAVARDGQSTCSICGGRDAYGLSTERPEDKKKTLTTA